MKLSPVVVKLFLGLGETVADDSQEDDAAKANGKQGHSLEEVCLGFSWGGLGWLGGVGLQVSPVSRGSGLCVCHRCDLLSLRILDQGKALISPSQPLAGRILIHKGIDGMHHKGLLKKASPLGKEISSQLEVSASFTDVGLAFVISKNGAGLGTFQQSFSPLLKIGCIVAKLIALFVDGFSLFFGKCVCHR